MTPVMKFGDGKSAKQAQRDTMTSFGPTRLATHEKWAGEVVTRKVRVWADGQYRAQNVRWQESFESPLELANLVLESNFGLRFHAEYHEWERNVPGATLDDDMRALYERDPGTDVFAVIGLTTSLPLVSSTFEALGRAAVGGRHTVLRGYADLEERKLYANAFPDLRAEERELALDHLRHHKTAVVLLHEIGHLFGVEHETDATTIMYASYSNHASAFSAAARATMLATVDERLGRASSKPTSVAAVPAKPAAQTKPPEAAPAQDLPATPHAPITIRVTRKRTTIVDGKQLGAAELDALLKAAIAQDPRTKLVISEDKNLPAGVVGDLIDRAKAIGFKKIEFAWSGH